MSSKWTRLTIFALFLAAVPAPARAEPRTHDGFYLRMALGMGGLSVERDGSSSSGMARDTSTSGGGGLFDLSLGGTLGRGFTLGGTILSHTIVEPSLEASDGTSLELEGPMHFVLIGPALDWYPNPSGGLHFGGALGLGLVVGTLPQSAPARSIGIEHVGGTGFGLSLAGGYDWWLAREWSLGVSARLSAAKVQGERTELGITFEENDTAVAFTLAATALFH